MSGRGLVPFALDQYDRVTGRLLDEVLEMSEVGKNDVVEEALDALVELSGIVKLLELRPQDAAELEQRRETVVENA
jgi:hypothetical protein